MVGKRVQFDDETWQAIEAVARRTGSGFQELTDEAFADLLKKAQPARGPNSLAQGERRNAEKGTRAKEMSRSAAK